MSLCSKTSIDNLYTAVLDLVTTVTGRPAWRKMGLQVAPKGPYATVYLKEGPSATQDVIDNVSLDEGGFSQSPVGLTLLTCSVEFFRNVSALSATEAAIRFRQSLQMESRFQDLWNICGLVGEIRFVDVSEMFRHDIEGRAQIHFNLYADIGALPFNTTDNAVSQIDALTINLYRTDSTTPVIKILNISSPFSIQGNVIQFGDGTTIELGDGTTLDIPQ